MAEVQQSTQAGETTARFIEFVQMQYQNACLFLGLIPSPQGEQPEVNLDLARMFIDQLAMIGEKTRGNLSGDETKVLRNALTNLQMAYVEVSQSGGPEAQEPSQEISSGVAPAPPDIEPKPEPVMPAATAAAAAPLDESRESKKRFTKSYGS